MVGEDVESGMGGSEGSGVLWFRVQRGRLGYCRVSVILVSINLAKAIASVREVG